RRPAPEGPLALADPALAVAKRVPGIAWPIGTGAYWVSGATADLTAAPVGGARRPVLRWRPAGGDQRDLLDAGVDLLVTDDPGARWASSRRPWAAASRPEATIGSSSLCLVRRSTLARRGRPASGGAGSPRCWTCGAGCWCAVAARG